MYLVVVSAQGSNSPSSVLVSVWVKEADPALAQQHAYAALEAAGFTITALETIAETGPEDYFRPCESKAAFERAEREGIAWRVAGE